MTDQMSRLTLYHFPSCPYCQRVERAISALGVRLERRNIRKDDDARQALLHARGRKTVPVLLIEDEGADPVWLPESKDIVDYLYREFGEGRRPSWWSNLHPWAPVAVALAALAVAGLLKRFL